MMTNSRPVLRSWLVLIALALNLPACSRQPESTAKPAKPAEAQIQAYRAIGGRQVIAIISTNELELREGGENLVCTYTQQGNKLRVIVNVMGTTTAKYFDVTPMGLVDEGGNVFYEPETFEKVTAQIRLNTGLMEAVKQNNAAGIDRFVIEGANVEARDDRGTALVVAVQKCATRAVEALLKNGADPNQKNDDGLTPLMMAVSLGNNWERARKQELDNIASLLCSNGADLDLSDQMGNTALILSIINNRLEAGRILVAAGADRAIKNHEGHDAIFYAGDDGEKQDVIRPFVGILDGAAVPAAEYRAAYNRTYLARALQLGRKVDSTPESESRMRELSWMRLATLREAANLGIGATDEELKDAIQSNFAETNGVSSSDRYNAFIATTIKPLGFSAVEYEQHLRENIIIKKLAVLIGNQAQHTPLEILRISEALLDTFIVEYVLIRDNPIQLSKISDDHVEQTVSIVGHVIQSISPPVDFIRPYTITIGDDSGEFTIKFWRSVNEDIPIDTLVTGTYVRVYVEIQKYRDNISSILQSGHDLEFIEEDEYRRLIAMRNTGGAMSAVAIMQEAIASGMAAGRSFKEITENMKQQVIITKPFTCLSASTSKDLNMRAIAQVVVGHNTGDVMDPISVWNNTMVAYVAERTSADPVTVKQYQAEIVESVRRRRARDLFHDWQNELLASARFTDLHSLGQAESDALLKVASYDNAATEEIILNEAGEALTMSATAAKAYEQQDYEIALTTYQNIISRHSESILASHAHLGVASCQEALGKYEQAAESYEAYAGANRYCILYPYAVHGVARCREQLGQFDVARQIYQEFIEENAKSAWRLRAETAQLLLNRNERNHK